MYISPQIVVGFHGCDKEIADKVIKHNGELTASTNDYDWLGHGIYFWEGSYDRAFQWAENSKSANSAVIGAFIRLGNCFDLLDTKKHLPILNNSYEMLKIECSNSGSPLPENKVYIDDISFSRQLDCQVISRVHQINNEVIAKDLGLSNIEGDNKLLIQKHPNFIDSVRGMFPEGKELYEGAGFRDKNHIQLCIINPNCIIGYFNPKKQRDDFKKI